MPDVMTLARLRALDAAATPPPWRIDETEGFEFSVRTGGTACAIPSTGEPVCDAAIEADAALIIVARNALTPVLELIARARAISDGDRMTVYVADLEAALGLRPDVAPSKIGQNDGGT